MVFDAPTLVFDCSLQFAIFLNPPAERATAYPESLCGVCDAAVCIAESGHDLSVEPYAVELTLGG
jgi:hypothetical protein